MRRTLRSITRRPRIALATAVLAAIALVTTVALQPHPSPTRPPVYTPQVRTRVYSSYTACLLTGTTGITDPRTAPVWAGMQAASTATRAQASYLPIQGPQTATNADAYINALALRGCSLIVTAGIVPGQGAVDRAPAIPRISFITVGAPGSKAANITAVTTTTPAAITRQITALITADAGKTTP